MKNLTTVFPYTYAFQCEGIKEHITTNELVKGDICYDYGLFDGCTKVIITQNAQYSNITDKNSHQEKDLKKLSSNWYTLWLVSCSFNIVFATIFAVIIAKFYYKRYGYWLHFFDPFGAVLLY